MSRLAILWAPYNNGQLDELLSEGDFNGDGRVTSADLAMYSANSGRNRQTLWLLADLNSDFAVDDLDADILANNVGMSNPTWANGDLNADGAVSDADLDLMFAQYGLDLEVVS